MRDPFEIMGLDAGATDAEIRKAWKQKSLACHPDKNPNHLTATKQFQQLSEAYDILSDPRRKELWAKVPQLCVALSQYAKRPHPSAFMSVHSAVFDFLGLPHQSDDRQKLDEILCAEVSKQVQRLAACMRSRPSGQLMAWLKRTKTEIFEVRSCLYCLQCQGMQNTLEGAWLEARVEELSEAFWAHVASAVEGDNFRDEVKDELVTLVDVFSRCGSPVTPLCVPLPQVKQRPVAALRAMCVKLLCPLRPVPCENFDSTRKIFNTENQLFARIVVDYLSQGDLVQLFGLSKSNNGARMLQCLAHSARAAILHS